MPENKLLFFFDTVVLSNFCFASGGISLLKKIYSNKGRTTFQVIQEIRKAMYFGYTEFENIEDQLFSRNAFQITSLKENEQSEYLILLKNLGEGEASCLAMAMFRKGVVVTDDRLARSFCKEKSVPFSGTIGILKSAYEDKYIDLKTADLMLKEMIDKGFYSPVKRISDL